MNYLSKLICFVFLLIAHILHSTEDVTNITIDNQTINNINLNIQYNAKCIDPQTGNVQWQCQGPLYQDDIAANMQKTFTLEPCDRAADSTCYFEIPVKIYIDGKPVLDQILTLTETHTTYIFRGSATKGYTLKPS